MFRDSGNDHAHTSSPADSTTKRRHQKRRDMTRLQKNKATVTKKNSAQTRSANQLQCVPYPLIHFFECGWYFKNLLQHTAPQQPCPSSSLKTHGEHSSRYSQPYMDCCDICDIVVHVPSRKITVDSSGKVSWIVVAFPRATAGVKSYPMPEKKTAAV